MIHAPVDGSGAGGGVLARQSRWFWTALLVWAALLRAPSEPGWPWRVLPPMGTTAPRLTDDAEPSAIQRLLLRGTGARQVTGSFDEEDADGEGESGGDVDPAEDAWLGDDGSPIL